MIALEDLSTSTSAFSSSAFEADGALTLVLVGDASLTKIESMQAVIDGLHALATQLGTKAVVVDLTKLDFMNSSCFKVFVSWINQVQEAEPAKQYRICLRSNPKVLWQRRSLHALQCFAAELITIETI